MELIDRYVYDVTRRLPSAQAPAVETKLRGRIVDMLSAASLSGLDETAAIESVLKELGHPALLADSFRGVERHLIGPGLYYLYELVLKIVLLAVGGGLLVAMTISFLASGGKDPGRMVLEGIGSILTGLIGAFGWVTLIFAGIERYSPETIAVMKREAFDPKDLPELPLKTDRIHPADPIVSMILTLLAMIAAAYAPRFIGFYPSGGTAGSMIPLLNEPVYRTYLPFILIVLAISMAEEIAKLASGRWTTPLAVLHLAVSLPGVVLTIRMFSDPSLFNNEFFGRLFSFMGISDPMLLQLPMPGFISRQIGRASCRERV